MISLIKVKVVGGRKNADFLDPERGETSRGRAILILRQVVVILIVLH